MAKSQLNDTLPPKTISFPEDNIEIKMTYGMLAEILKIIGDGENAIEVLIGDSHTRDLVIRRIFTNTKEPVLKVEDLVSSYDIDLDPLSVDELIAWVADHVTHFTISTVKKTQAVVQKYEDKAASLNPSKNGSED